MPSSLTRWVMTARRSLRSSSGRPALSAKWKTRPRLLSCVSLSPSTLLSSSGPNDVMRGAHRHAGPEPAQAPGTRRGTRGACQSVPVSAARCVTRSLAAPGAAMPDTSPLMSARNTGTPGVRQLLGDELQRLGLARAGRAGHQPVPVEHGQRHPDRRVGVGGAVEHDRPEVERRSVERVRARAGRPLGRSWADPSGAHLRRRVGPMSERADRLVWIDCEMTGLELGSDLLIEVAALVTDSELNVLGEGIDVVIGATRSSWRGMLARRPGHARRVRPHRGGARLHRDAAGGRAAGARVRQGARARGAQGAAVRQLDRHRPRLPHPRHARARRRGCTTGWSTSARSRSWPAAGTRGPTTRRPRRAAGTGRWPTSPSRCWSCATTAPRSWCRRPGRRPSRRRRCRAPSVDGASRLPEPSGQVPD